MALIPLYQRHQRNQPLNVTTLRFIWLFFYYSFGLFLLFFFTTNHCIFWGKMQISQIFIRVSQRIWLCCHVWKHPLLTIEYNQTKKCGLTTCDIYEGCPRQGEVRLGRMWMKVHKGRRAFSICKHPQSSIISRLKNWWDCTYGEFLVRQWRWREASCSWLLDALWYAIFNF